MLLLKAFGNQKYAFNWKKKIFSNGTHLGTPYCYKANSNVITEEISISALLQCVLIVPAPGKTTILSTFKYNSFRYKPSHQIQIILLSPSQWRHQIFFCQTCTHLLTKCKPQGRHPIPHCPLQHPSFIPAHLPLPSCMHPTDHWPFHSSSWGLSSCVSHASLTRQCLETPQERGFSIGFR